MSKSPKTKSGELSIEERVELIKRNTAEIITGDELKDLLKKKKAPIVYCGYEINGPMHLGHFVTITKLSDFASAGFKVKVLLADVHTMLNRKTDDQEFINDQISNWKKTLKAIGLNCEVVLGSDFQFKPEYVMDVMKLAQKTTINRGLRSMQEVARDVDNATISQLWYPLMQIVDIKHLGADVSEGGLEQRKIYMTGRELSKDLDHPFIAVHTPLITSLKGPGSKMSKSIPGSGILVTDDYTTIKKTISEAYCPAKDISDNPILQIIKLIIFPRIKEFVIKRPQKFGGDLSFSDHQSLEKAYADGLHPMDLKNATIEYLEEIIKPIREGWKK